VNLLHLYNLHTWEN
jgi:hypothetical protein